ncbi:acetyltransferase [Citrobacter koseri]|nr:acetyltransferase [Citrobacter koseri]
MEARFLGALFVTPDAIRRGIGKALVQHVQQRFTALSLEVYQKNQSAVNFYHALGFVSKTAHGRKIHSIRHGLWAGRRIKRRKRQRGAGILFNPRQRGVARTAVPQSRTGEIFGQHVYRAIFTNAASRHL